MNKKIKFALPLLALPMLAMSACAGSKTAPDTNATESAQTAFTFKNDPVTVNAFKLDTYISISAYGDVPESELEKSLELCETYENLFSMHKEGSALYELNENHTDKVPVELGRVIEDALEWSKKSDGSFQITIGGVSSLWDFNSDERIIPDEAEIAEALKTVDDSLVNVYPENPDDTESDYIVEKPKETKIDLGAVAKGYIADKLKEDLIARGITSAIINLGGNVLCVGDKGGNDFNIGIREPFAGEADMIVVLGLKDRSAVSSGISERYFEGEDGHIYHHILDPRTGYPYDNGLWQTTIISDDSFTGDMMSTICYCLGAEKGLELAESTEGVEAILVTDKEELIYTDGARDLVR